MKFSHFYCNFVSLSPKYLYKYFILDLLNLYSSVKVRDQVSQPYNATGNITVLCVLTFYLFGKQAEWQHFFKWITTCNFHVYSAINFFVNFFCICYVKSVALQPRRAKTDWSDCCQMAVQGILWLAKCLSLNLNFSSLNRISLLLIQVQ